MPLPVESSLTNEVCHHRHSAVGRSSRARLSARDLLEQALTHSSYAREAESQSAADGVRLLSRPTTSRLEFLGDAVLSFVVSQELFRRFPEYQEGELSKLRAHIVSARRLLRPARELKIGDYLRLGRGEDRSGGRGKSALLVNALEAIIAALYLDAGLEPRIASSCEHILEPELAEVRQQGGQRLPVMDYKSASAGSGACQRTSSAALRAGEGGGPGTPQDCSPWRRTSRRRPPEATTASSAAAKAATKKAAEQAAARQAWEHLQSLQSSSAA